MATRHQRYLRSQRLGETRQGRAYECAATTMADRRNARALMLSAQRAMQRIANDPEADDQKDAAACVKLLEKAVERFGML